MEKNALSKVCRLCLSTDVKLIAVFNKKRKSSSNTIKWDTVILELLEIQVSLKETLPKKICMICYSVLESFVHFKKKAQNNDQKLHQLIKQMNEQPQVDESEPEQGLDYFPPYEYEETGDVVVIDPKREYLSSDEADETEQRSENEEFYEESEELVDVQNYTVMEIEEPAHAEPQEAIDGDDEVGDINQIEIEPEDYSQLNYISPSKIIELKAEPNHESELEEDVESNEINNIENSDEILPLQIEEISQISNILHPDYPSNEVQGVDENVMQDIIDIFDDDELFAVLADPSCMNLEIIESNEEIDDNSKSIEPVEVYVCRYCDGAFASPVLLDTHEAEHDSQLPFACPVCGNFKTTERDLCISHIREAHNQPKPYYCFHCNKKFKERSELRKHAVRHAGLKTLFVCAICNKNFSRRNNLRHHLKIHTGERFGCSQCPKSFSTKHALLEHEDYHKNSANYKCPCCGVLVTRKRRLAEHERNCIKKNYQNLPSDLDPENVMVINLDPDLARSDLPFENDEAEEDTGSTRISCDVCLKTFSSKRVLRHHRAIHTGAKKHICTCGRAFLRRNELDRHQISVHKQVKEHQCKICQKSFSRKDKLLRHERIHNKSS